MKLIRGIKKLIYGSRKRSYNSIQYREPGTPEQHTERLLQLIAQDFASVRERTDGQCLLFGRFMSVVLLIERKLVRLMMQFDEHIDDRMFGQKIEVFKDFLREFEWNESGLEIEDFRALIGPMKEIKAIRDAMAHDLSKVSIAYQEIRQTVGYIRRRRPDLYKTFSETEDENLRSFGAVGVFAFIFSEHLAGIQCQIQ